jgi:hypothetical protein
MRLGVIAMSIPTAVRGYSEIVANASDLWWLGPQMIASLERSASNTFLGLGTAVFVEVSYRAWRRLRDEDPGAAI